MAALGLGAGGLPLDATTGDGCCCGTAVGAGGAAAGAGCLGDAASCPLLAVEGVAPCGSSSTRLGCVRFGSFAGRT